MNIKRVVAPGVVGVAAIAGLAGGSALNGLSASADTTSTTATGASTSTSAADPVDTPNDESKGGHVGTNGTTEVLLTGDAATKAKAAAEAAVAGGTVQRVENDAEGATYEAHILKSDGSEVTVKMDANFKVTSTESGHGAR
jgi:uncharacterized membrane protein YkoI